LKRSKFYIKETDLKSMKRLQINETYFMSSLSCQKELEMLEITAQRSTFKLLILEFTGKHATLEYVYIAPSAPRSER
jgi:hypothetical protein